MKYDRSLKEVWQWKEDIYKDIKKLSIREQLNYISRQAKKASKKYRLRATKTLN